jgi:hypothetical protein
VTIAYHVEQSELHVHKMYGMWANMCRNSRERNMCMNNYELLLLQVYGSRSFIQLVYNFMAVRGVYYIAWLDSLLQNPENDIKMLQHLQDLLIHIAESGIFSMNPDGFKWMLGKYDVCCTVTSVI